MDDGVMGQDLAIHCLIPSRCTVDPGWRNLKRVRTGSLPGNLWEQIDLPYQSKDGLLFSPGNIGPYFHPNQVVTLHDTSVFAFPEAYSFTFRLKYRLILQRMGKIARRIITVSNFSKRELMRWCGIPSEKIDVTYEGYEHIDQIAADPEVLIRRGIDNQRPYFLAVGSNSPHKNLQAVLRAFERMKRHDVDLIVTGGNFSKVFNSDDLTLPANAYRIGYVSDGELKALYQGALALVFPSRYEGFGIPPLEAMACGCPVISTTAASLSEVCGEAALYFDPLDIDGLEKHLERVVSDPSQRDLMRQAGLEQAKKFSWRKMALQTWEILESCL